MNGRDYGNKRKAKGKTNLSPAGRAADGPENSEKISYGKAGDYMEKREQTQTLTQQMQYYTTQELRQETRVFRKELERKTDYFRLNNFIELAAMTQGFYLALHDYEKCLS